VEIKLGKQQNAPQSALSGLGTRAMLATLAPAVSDRMTGPVEPARLLSGDDE